MEFHEFTSVWQIFTREGIVPKGTDHNAWYRELWQAAAAQVEPAVANQFMTEWLWYADKRPYYCVYPAIIGMLTRLSLEIDTALIQMPNRLRVLLIRFPKNPAQNPLRFGPHDEHRVRSILLGHAHIRDSQGMTLWIDVGERIRNYMGLQLSGDGAPIYTYRNFRTIAGRTIEQELADLPEDPSAQVGLNVPRELVKDCVRIATALCLLEDDPEIVNPDVLADDREKFQRTGDAKYVEKAVRHGRRGWIVGAGIEVIPHLRRPHAFSPVEERIVGS